MNNDEKLDIIKQVIKSERKKAAKREQELKKKLSQVAEKTLELSNENYRLKMLRSTFNSVQVDNANLRSVIYKMHAQIQCMYRATVLPDMFLPGGKIIFPSEMMQLQADWFYTVQEELHNVLDLKRLGMNVDDQII